MPAISHFREPLTNDKSSEMGEGGAFRIVGNSLHPRIRFPAPIETKTRKGFADLFVPINFTLVEWEVS